MKKITIFSLNHHELNVQIAILVCEGWTFQGPPTQTHLVDAKDESGYDFYTQELWK